MVKREVQHLDSEGCTTAYYAHWAAEPIPLGRRAARKEDLESVAGALRRVQVVGPRLGEWCRGGPAEEMGKVARSASTLCYVTPKVHQGLPR